MVKEPVYPPGGRHPRTAARYNRTARRNGWGNSKLLLRVRSIWLRFGVQSRETRLQAVAARQFPGPSKVGRAHAQRSREPVACRMGFDSRCRPDGLRLGHAVRLFKDEALPGR